MQNSLVPRPSRFETSLVEMDPREFEQLRSLVHKHAGIWLKDGKQVMLAARLSRRLRHHGLRSYGEYYDYVQAHAHDTDELRELINCVTTNKTSFFRERHHFDFLARTLVPRFLAGRQPGAHEPIRIWSAACSTGEEAYSIAITLLEMLGGDERSGCSSGRPPRVNTAAIQIVASDIDTQVLAAASKGIYREDSLTTIDRTLWKKYFLRGKGNMAGWVRVKPELHQAVQFRQINLMASDWPLGAHFDAIFFRNALIYFREDTQDLLLRRMGRLLKPGGYLFLGNSEHISWLNDIYEPLKQTVYRLRHGAR